VLAEALDIPCAMSASSDVTPLPVEGSGTQTTMSIQQ
jgi:hypothetical protein